MPRPHSLSDFLLDRFLVQLEEGALKVLYEQGIELNPFWQSSLLHRFFDITRKDHAVQSTSLPDFF